MGNFGVTRNPESDMNAECDRIANQLASMINGEAWYGDSLREILNGVAADQAQAHPSPNAHSIWELLSHVESWVKFAIAAVGGVPIPPWPQMPVELDWPAVSDTSEAAWNRAVDSFFSYHLELVETIKGFTDERLEAIVPGRTCNFYRLFHGTTQHAVYHAGQISLLKKMTMQN
jgi:DinB superfamily